MYTFITELKIINSISLEATLLYNLDTLASLTSIESDITHEIYDCMEYSSLKLISGKAIKARADLN
jgi:hypothetical protein